MSGELLALIISRHGTPIYARILCGKLSDEAIALYSSFFEALITFARRELGRSLRGAMFDEFVVSFDIHGDFLMALLSRDVPPLTPVLFSELRRVLEKYKTQDVLALQLQHGFREDVDSCLEYYRALLDVRSSLGEAVHLVERFTPKATTRSSLTVRPRMGEPEELTDLIGRWLISEAACVARYLAERDDLYRAIYAKLLMLANSSETTVLSGDDLSRVIESVKTHELRELLLHERRALEDPRHLTEYERLLTGLLSELVSYVKESPAAAVLAFPCLNTGVCREIADALKPTSPRLAALFEAQSLVLDTIESLTHDARSTRTLAGAVKKSLEERLAQMSPGWEFLSAAYVVTLWCLLIAEASMGLPYAINLIDLMAMRRLRLMSAIESPLPALFRHLLLALGNALLFLVRACPPDTPRSSKNKLLDASLDTVSTVLSELSMIERRPLRDPRLLLMVKPVSCWIQVHSALKRGRSPAALQELARNFDCLVQTSRATSRVLAGLATAFAADAVLAFYESRGDSRVSSLRLSRNKLLSHDDLEQVVALFEHVVRAKPKEEIS